MSAPVDGVGDPALEPGARVAELERVRVREVPQINRVRIRHVVELRIEPHLCLKKKKGKLKVEDKGMVKWWCASGLSWTLVLYLLPSALYMLV